MFQSTYNAVEINGNRARFWSVCLASPLVREYFVVPGTTEEKLAFALDQKRDASGSLAAAQDDERHGRPREDIQELRVALDKADAALAAFLIRPVHSGRGRGQRG